MTVTHSSYLLWGYTGNMGRGKHHCTCARCSRQTVCLGTFDSKNGLANRSLVDCWYCLAQGNALTVKALSDPLPFFWELSPWLAHVPKGTVTEICDLNRREFPVSSWDKKSSFAFDSCYSSEPTSEVFQIFILGVKLPFFVFLLTKQDFPDIGTCQADM